MALKRETYRALEDIVGPEYITGEPAILDSYCFVWSNEVVFGDKFGVRPEAVILPGSVEEIQAIVRACNRYKIKFKAHGTGFSTTAFGVSEGWLSIDLRRMDRILEIDEKNMYAVVEPYVPYGRLISEANKKGLRSPTASPGPSASVVASLTSMSGTDNISVAAGKNLSSVEWVLPDGEILRLGSAEIGAGWFDGDGPGPSLKAVIRGVVGATGAMGIFTKMAVRLTPWYGPPVMETTGKPPAYEVVEIPKCFRFYTILFPSRQKLIEALYVIAEQGIAYNAFRRGQYSIMAGMTGSNQELWELWQTGYWQEKCQHNMNIVIDSSSPRELEYREKVLRQIVERFDGEIPPELNEDIHGQKARFLYVYNCVGATKGVFRPGTAFVEMASMETLDLRQNSLDVWLPLKLEYTKKGLFLDDGDSAQVMIGEDGRGGGGSSAVRYDPLDPESVKAIKELRERLGKAWLEENMCELAPFEDPDVSGPRLMNYHLWIQKIKMAFDPNLVSESACYPTPGVKAVKIVA